MPYHEDEPKKNLAGAYRALRKGGAELEAITGEPEPEIPDTNTLRQGFRRLLGVAKPERRYGSEE